VIHYRAPASWIIYDARAIAAQLVEAKAAVLSLRSIPYQRSWVDALQRLEFKREIAGTSRIEGADFTERELEEALKEVPAQELATRSQKQAAAAVQAYRWIARLEDDRPIDANLIREIHRRMVVGADDDHCPPGKLRDRDENVNFGSPRHRGVDGGSECSRVFAELVHAIGRDFRDHDPLVGALAAHYHLAAMHPFLDGNGRTARALEALMLQRAGLRDTCFVAMSNYYYDEKRAYLGALAEVRSKEHDLTPFILLGLKGVALQSKRLLGEIEHEISKSLFRNLMFDLFQRLKSPRRRVIVKRELEILKILLEKESLPLDDLVEVISSQYESLGNPRKAIVKDLNDLVQLKAVRLIRESGGKLRVEIVLDWPTMMTESEFFETVRRLPKAKTHSFLDHD